MIGFIESDFQREYGIDLVISHMSWRKFMNLLSGLSSDSAFMQKMSKKPEMIEDPTDIAADIKSMLGRKKK